MRHLWSLLLLAFAVSAEAGTDDTTPDFLIRVPPSVRTVFVAETTAAAFHRFDNPGGEGVRYRGRHYMSIGRDGDGKQEAGDRRTPLGIYFVTEQLDTSRMHEKYGATAFPLDYPSTWDKRLQRSGDGIWVHGVDARVAERPRLDTDGCIALPNDALASLEELFVPNTTPVVVARNVLWVPHARMTKLRSELEDVLTSWAGSLEQGNMHGYLSLYDESFQRWGLNKTEWTALQLATVASRSIERVNVDELLLLGDPNESGLYLSRFRLALTESGETVVTTKRLYWRRSPSGAFRIVAEDAG